MSRFNPLEYIDGRKIRSSLVRLPLATRLIILVIIIFYITDWITPSFRSWAVLQPSEVVFPNLRRLNTFPFLCLTTIQFLIFTTALTPLLDRFECEHGTLMTIILFTGPFATIPGILYLFFANYIFHSNSAVAGPSIWVFLLIGNEAIKQWKSNPNFELGGVKVPTWTFPLVACLVVSGLVPRVSFMAHLCGLAVGYAWGTGWIRFLAPGERVLKWVEGKANLLGRLPHYVSVDQKTYGRYGLLPSTSVTGNVRSPVGVNGIRSGSHRLGA